MTACANPKDNINALIECSLCLSTFQQPKCLPCIHTFCQDCLQQYIDKNEPSTKLPCPLCCHMFIIPPQGLSSLPNNFFIQNMIELNRSSGVELERLNVEVKCDLCLDENKQDALKYCVECEQNMCSSCIAFHARMNSAKSHLLVLLSEKSEAIAKSLQSRPRTCDKHSNLPIHLYCLKCDVCLCVSCMLIEHSDHKCTDIMDACTKYIDQFEENISTISNALALGYKTTEKLNDAENQIIIKSSQNEAKIKERCDELRKILGSFEEDLLSEARKFTEKGIKEIKSQLDQVDFQNLQLQGFIRYLSELKGKGSSYDIASSGRDLATRAEHLLTLSKETYSKELKMINVTFLPCNESNRVEFGRNCIGKLVAGEKLLVTVGVNEGDTVQQEICMIPNRQNLNLYDVTGKNHVFNSTLACIPNESAVSGQQCSNYHRSAETIVVEEKKEESEEEDDDMGIGLLFD